MCGIVGAMWTDPRRSLDDEIVLRMMDQLRHRGPDDQGQYRQDYLLRPPLDPLPGVALGFRRLSIIDLEGGHQPMSNEDGSVWVIFNGEIYNYRELRRRLEGSGHAFSTNSDTETIVHLYEDEGPECFSLLNGMFAIAIWDSKRRQLVLGRDRLGQKPLVYRHQPGRLMFANELKSLHEVPDLNWEIDSSAIDEYLLYQYVPHPNTIWKGVQKLPPGCRLVYRDDRVDVSPYWAPDWTEEPEIGHREAVERLRELLTSAVHLRMRSDVPLGAFLSGGVDSSLIVALMQQQSSQPVKTFSIGFSQKQYDESRYARLVANHLKTDHHEFVVEPSSVEIIDRLTWHFDEPFADSSAIPTWYVSQFTREHVTVALTGDGGDELFAGYPRYRAVALSRTLDAWPTLKDVITAPMWKWLPAGSRQKSIWRRARRFADAASLSPQRRYLEWIAIFNEARRAALYRDDYLEQLPSSDPAAFMLRAWDRAGSRDPVTAASLCDLTTYLPCDLMTKVDRASMAHSLEARSPMLDFRVVEFAANLPLSLKYRLGKGKRLLRDAFADLLPGTIWRRPKMGFGAPLDAWFRGELKTMTADLLLSDSTRVLRFFRRDAIERLFQEHLQRSFEHSYRLWSLLMLENWMRLWGERQTVASPRASLDVTIPKDATPEAGRSLR